MLSSAAHRTTHGHETAKVAGCKPGEQDFDNDEERPVNQTDFASFISYACTNHEAGFHFYDEGYAAMAVALFEEFERRGLECSLHVREDVRHAYAFADGYFVDGERRGRPEDQRPEFRTRQADRQTVIDLAITAGQSREMVESDLEEARRIVASAVELHADHIAATQVLRDRYGLDELQAVDLYWILEDAGARRVLLDMAEGGFAPFDFHKLSAHSSLFYVLRECDDVAADLASMDEDIGRHGPWVFFERLGQGRIFSADARTLS